VVLPTAHPPTATGRLKVKKRLVMSPLILAPARPKRANQSLSPERG
jgi:hypothetical protein